MLPELPEEDDAPLDEIDAAWIKEAERRYDNLCSGKTQAIPGDGFFADIRRELGWSCE